MGNRLCSAVAYGITTALRRLGSAYSRLIELRAGRRLFLVGGTIRDLLLGRAPTDYDFAVSGSGLDFAGEFARAVRGKLVVLSKEDDEARVVSRDRVLDFNGFGDRDVETDLARRDFTINALGCEVLGDGVGPVIDVTGGRQDLEAGVIRPVSAGALASDPLRLLRAFRLALELGMAIHEDVYAQGRGVSLAGTAGERIVAELLRIMESPGSLDGMLRLHEMGRLAEILPGFVPVLDDDKLRKHSFRTYLKIEELVSGPSFFSAFEPEWQRYFENWDAAEEGESGLPYRRALLKLAGLLHDTAKPETRFTTAAGEVHFYGHDSLGARAAERMLRERLRMSRAQVKMVRTLVQEHMRLHLLATNPDLTDRAIRRFFRDLEDEAFGLMVLCYADGWATAEKTYHLEDTITRMINQKREEDANVGVERYVTGHDLITLGMKPGPAFKVILQELEDLQVEGRITSREQGLEYVKANLPGLEGQP